MDKINLTKLTEITRGRIDRHKVFSDFIELAAIRISNRVDPVHFMQRDERAKQINKSYTASEHTEMYRYLEELMHQIATNQRVGKIEDILGQLFEGFGFSRSGQDQSPPDVARLAAMLSLGRSNKIPNKGFIDLNECACGSGSMILAAAEVMMSKGLNYCEQLVVMATDSDSRCIHMAYIQLSLYGIPAVVIHGNTITLQEHTRWYTPMYILGKWVWRRPFSLSGVQSADDELLKRATDPLYDAMRDAIKLFEA